METSSHVPQINGELSASDQRADTAAQQQLLVSCKGFKSVILDMGGVFLSAALHVDHGTAVPPEMFKRMRRLHIWFAYEKGELTSEEAFRQLSVHMGVDASEIKKLIQRARESLAPVPEVVHIIEQLSGKMRLFCMSNVSREDFKYVQDRFPWILAMFEKVFTSAACKLRKPGLNFFRHVIRETGNQPSETLFVDDTLENVVAAESLGITSILATSRVQHTVRELISHLRNKDDKLTAAREYLLRNKGHPSLTSDGIRVQEPFCLFLIADVLNDAQFLPVEYAKTSVFNFFGDDVRRQRSGHPPDYSTRAYIHTHLPDDMDTTSTALSVLHKFSRVDSRIVASAVEKMKDLIDQDGILQVYFDPLRPRVDPVSATNIVNLFHLAGPHSDLVRGTEEFIRNVLLHRAYLRGTLYYSTAEAFLYFLARLVQANPDHFRESGLRELLVERLRERLGLEGDALQIAMRMLACSRCGIAVDARDRERLSRMQNVDGSWDVCPIYKYGSSPNSWFGNEALTTAFAFMALHENSL